MNNLSFLSIKELRELLDSKKITQEQLLDHYIERFKKYDADLGSALEVFDKESVLKASQNNGILAGIPGLLKDNIAQENRALSCASKILEGLESTFDATASSRLKKEGALLLGRANCDEFAMGSSNETSAYQKTKNPWDSSRVSGGSSGGSAAAVAAGLVPWALGSDTGGSVRQPAGFCGIVGSKPTYGLISRYGLVAYASSLDQIGIFTRTVYDNALVMSAIAGHDPKDSTSLNVPKTDYTKSLDSKLPENFTIGVVENALYAEGMDPEVVAAIEQAIAEFEKLGTKIKKITLPILDYSAAVYFIVSRAEAASNLARFDGVRYGLRAKDSSTLEKLYCNTRHDGFGPEVRSRIMIGNYVLSAGHADAFIKKAKKVQAMIRQGFVDAYKEVDLLLMPTAPMPAFKFGAFDVDKLQMDLQDYFTCGVNLAGNCAISIPGGFTKAGLPIGFQLIGPHLGEEIMFKAAHAYEQVTPWYKMTPKGF
ncbi:MAG: glutamyl-tRNA(Gln) amidotransferase subunit A [Candidatus Babeliales bacterium]